MRLETGVLRQEGPLCRVPSDPGAPVRVGRVVRSSSGLAGGRPRTAAARAAVSLPGSSPRRPPNRQRWSARASGRAGKRGDNWADVLTVPLDRGQPPADQTSRCETGSPSAADLHPPVGRGRKWRRRSEGRAAALRPLSDTCAIDAQLGRPASSSRASFRSFPEIAGSISPRIGVRRGITGRRFLRRLPASEGCWGPDRRKRQARRRPPPEEPVRTEADHSDPRDARRREPQTASLGRLLKRVLRSA
jgi:hypothetical protein